MKNIIENVFQNKSENNKDFLKEAIKGIFQEILEEEIERHVNAAKYERSENRNGHRNGYKDRSLITRVGKLELRVPQTRDGSFSTSIFEKYQRSEKAFVLSLLEMYVNGISTRKVKKITEQLCGESISKSLVSSLTKCLDEKVSKWRSRNLEMHYPYLVVDANYKKVRENHKVISKAVIVVMGVRIDGFREILGTYTGNSENQTIWRDVFCDLKERGINGIKLVVSDYHKGLVKAIEREFQGCEWQRCQFHLMKNIREKVKPKMRAELVSDIQTVFNSGNKELAYEYLERVIDKYQDSYPELADYLEENVAHSLTVFNFPKKHRKRLRTTNTLERLNQELKRRTQVIRIFPNEKSLMRLVTTLCMEISEEWITGKRYLDMSIEEIDKEKQEEKRLSVVN